MATQWGAWTNVGTNLGRYRTQVEITHSPTNITPSTTQVTVTVRLRLQGEAYSYGTNGRWEMIRDIEDSAEGWSWNIANNGDIATPNPVVTRTVTVPLVYGQEQTFRIQGRIRPVMTWGGYTAHADLRYTIPARPVSAPATPSNLVVSRVNDGQQNLTWSRNHSTGAPYVRQEVSRGEHRSGVWGPWQTINDRVSGSATSFSDSSTRADRRYRYRVRAVNAAGTSGWDYGSNNSNQVHTTPASPTAAPLAVRQGSSTIVLTRPTISGAATGWQVQHEWTPPGTTAISSTIAANQDTFSHSPTMSSVHRYRVRALTDSPTLTSGWSPWSDTVQLLSPPSAPTHLSPNGETLDAASGSVEVSWRHNPTDSSPQTQFQLRRRIQGAGWTTFTIQTSSNQYANLTGLFNGNFYQWEVRTRGEHATWGPWSATANLITSARPVASVVSPDGGTVTLPSVTLEWAFFQPSGRTQVGWRVQIQSDGTVVEDRAGTGAGTSWTTPQVLANNTSYRWRVQVQDSSGQWSNWTAWSTPFHVAFVTPDEPEVTGVWEAHHGCVVLDINPDPEDGTPATNTLNIDRALDEDGPWERLAERLEPGIASWMDCTVPLGRKVYYRVTAVSALPSTSYTVIGIVTPETGYSYLGGGPGFRQVVRLSLRNTRSVETGRQRALHQYEGVEEPVEVSGDAVPHRIAVSAFLDGQDTRLALEGLFSLPGPHLYRDSDRSTVFGTLSGLQVSPDFLGEVGFSIERSFVGTWEQRQAAALIDAGAGRGLVEDDSGP